MPSNIYEVLAMGARYWFALLGVLIVLRSFLLLKKDGRLTKKRLRELPDAGFVGELELLESIGDFTAGTAFSVPWEGTLGYSRFCDIVLPVQGVAGKHCELLFKKKQGLYLIPYHGKTIVIDQEEITDSRQAMLHPLVHNSIVIIGDAVLRFHAFMGLELAHSASYADIPSEPLMQEQYAPQAAQMPYHPDAQAPYPLYSDAQQPLYHYAQHDTDEYEPAPYQASIPIFKQGYGPVADEVPVYEYHAPLPVMNEAPDAASPASPVQENQQPRRRRSDRHAKP